MGPHTAGYRRRPSGGGLGLVETLYARCEEAGVAVRYGTSAVELMVDDSGRVSGVRARAEQTCKPTNLQTGTEEQTGAVGDDQASTMVEFAARGGVVLASGFQANVAMRVTYLGRFADGLILRGSRHDTGDGIRMALDIGAQAAGQWGDYHWTQARRRPRRRGWLLEEMSVDS